MSKEKLFYVGGDGVLTSLAQVVELVKGREDEEICHSVSQSVLDSLTDAMMVGGLYPALAGCWFYIEGSDNEFLHVQAKGILKREANESLKTKIDRVTIIDELNALDKVTFAEGAEQYADAVALLRTLPESYIRVLFRIENKQPVSVSQRVSTKGNAKSKGGVSEAEREAITARIVDAIKQGKFPATPSKPELLKEHDYDIRLNGKYDYVATSKANAVYAELFAGDEILVSEKGDKPNTNRKVKWMSEGVEGEYFRRAKAKLGL
ncbi:hypothetical protein [Escherichia coli]|uniref:hypothetical protein n=1 Tax=Escherichia coli TaxID=562 RepID=UPI0037DC47D6